MRLTSIRPSTHNFSAAVVASLPDTRLNILRQYGFPIEVGSRLGEGFSVVTFLPYFSTWAGRRIVNPSISINALREMTKFMAPRLPLPYHPIIEGVEVRLYMEMTRQIPLPADGTENLLDIDRDAGYVPRRSAFVIACSFYFCTLIGEWHVERMRVSPCWHHLFDMLKRDVDQTRGALQIKGLRRDFWLWKVLIGAIGIVTMERQSSRRTFDNGASDDDGSLLNLKVWFFDHLRAWSRASGITDWSRASQALSNVVWTDKFCYGASPEAVFLEALRYDDIP